MVRIHPTADVSPYATIGDGTTIWHQCQVREGATIGEQCILGKNVYIDFDVQIGSRVKVQNNCCVYHGVTLEDGVFLGPHVVLINDPYPRAINPDGTLKGNDDWEVVPVHVGYGASIGARAVILPGVTVGRFAMVGAGTVVSRDVPPHGIVVGCPARLIGYACACGHRLQPDANAASGTLACPHCGATYANPPVAPVGR
jgi:UDP-2-acetamido-3-amino-2,3-dideoxy-glucuronate N-acetyltransferase